MKEEKTEIEPPDPNPRSLVYFLNGKGSPRRLFRFAEASNREHTYLLKLGAITTNPEKKIIFEYDGQNYTCIYCNTQALELPSSRDIKEDWIDHTITQCAKGPYCPNCEVYPKNGRLSPINERDLESAIKVYEELEKKGIQQTI